MAVPNHAVAAYPDRLEPEGPGPPLTQGRSTPSLKLTRTHTPLLVLFLCFKDPRRSPGRARGAITWGSGDERTTPASTGGGLRAPPRLWDLGIPHRSLGAIEFAAWSRCPGMASCRTAAARGLRLRVLGPPCYAAAPVQHEASQTRRPESSPVGLWALNGCLAGAAGLASRATVAAVT
jgi:hypothetical protein